jgi:bifunctional non-homologous end joining protein LigD
VAEINDKRSVRLSLLDGKNVVNAGNVTIPPNHKVPEVGATVDVRYLYAFKESGCLFQPVYIGERNDIDRESCTVTQLKYKPQEDDI